MMTITINYWLLLLGAFGGVGGALVARGSNRLIKAAIAGAAVVFLVDLARDLL
ncbi:hypothetical protein [Yoonia sp.]|uniref:hypothetical protein n=1 Tax=Yoonia sp. TaxID=2212373 RepID=UPI0025EE264D|nr:hypothetical protein [Yoonia sp.]